MKAITCEKCGAPLKVDMSRNIAVCEFCSIAYLLDDAVRSNVVEKWTSETETLLDIKDYKGALRIALKLIDEAPTDYRALLIYVRAFTHDFSQDDDDLKVMIEKQADLDLYNEICDRALSLVPKDVFDEYREKWEAFAEALNTFYSKYAEIYNDKVKAELEELFDDDY